MRKTCRRNANKKNVHVLGLIAHQSLGTLLQPTVILNSKKAENFLQFKNKEADLEETYSIVNHLHSFTNQFGDTAPPTEVFGQTSSPISVASSTMVAQEQHQELEALPRPSFGTLLLTTTSILFHIFLLVPDHYGKTMIRINNIQITEELYRTLKEKYVDADICIFAEPQLGVTKVLRNLVMEDRKASRRDSKLELSVLSQVFEEDKRVLAVVTRSCFHKLPSIDSTHEIREMDLITTFIDPVLATMLNRAETKKCFQWLNQQVVEYGTEPTNLRTRRYHGT
ncbi:hypothetical protein [Parasitella parasitica]|uniref:Uncharacterized protein n=1 Tax=Parasitella parasitica TaxID=35722 RepID=A0A0B7NUC8_9FUNG|nr:hypothetical protein [Parasitella parasitica]